MTITYQGTITTKVKVRLTAEDWELFTTSMNCNTAAAALNLAASKALTQGDRNAAWTIFDEAADAYAQYGASDTEPRNVFADLLDRYLP
jgi:hypothetical protein